MVLAGLGSRAFWPLAVFSEGGNEHHGTKRNVFRGAGFDNFRSSPAVLIRATKHWIFLDPAVFECECVVVLEEYMYVRRVGFSHKTSLAIYQGALLP